MSGEACLSGKQVRRCDLITVDEDLNLPDAPAVESDMEIESPLRAALGKPPLRDRLILPDKAERPDVVYLDWHRTQIYVAL
ncbi:hypothetical protein [Rhodococcus qingshengii]|uniref:hypothetical protein n=1 Tax=Rhodococcus qingshengii TaxID=334542 RepID=UPI0021AB8746|nr:hypothetical protein [Rhodococcus qingshengii]